MHGVNVTIQRAEFVVNDAQMAKIQELVAGIVWEEVTIINPQTLQRILEAEVQPDVVVTGPVRENLR